MTKNTNFVIIKTKKNREEKMVTLETIELEDEEIKVIPTSLVQLAEHLARVLNEDFRKVLEALVGKEEKCESS